MVKNKVVDLVSDLVVEFISDLVIRLIVDLEVDENKVELVCLVGFFA